MQELRLITSNMTTTVASAGSGVLSLVSKSGSNTLHGSAFYFRRLDGLAVLGAFRRHAGLDPIYPAFGQGTGHRDAFLAAEHDSGLLFPIA
jgi:hypothetical protein